MAVFTLAVKAASSVYSPTPRWVVLSVWVAQAERPSAAAAITAPRVLDTRIRIRIPTSCHSRETGEIAAIFMPARSAPIQEFPSRHAVRCAMRRRRCRILRCPWLRRRRRSCHRAAQAFLEGAFAVQQQTSPGIPVDLAEFPYHSILDIGNALSPGALGGTSTAKRGVGQLFERPLSATTGRSRSPLRLATPFHDTQVDCDRQIHIRAGGPCVVKTTAEQLPQLGSRVGHQSRVDRFKRQAKRAARLGDRAAEPGTRVRVAARERNGGGCGEAPRESVCVSHRAAEPE